MVLIGYTECLSGGSISGTHNASPKHLSMLLRLLRRNKGLQHARNRGEPKRAVSPTPAFELAPLKTVRNRLKPDLGDVVGRSTVSPALPPTIFFRLLLGDTLLPPSTRQPAL